MFHGFLELTPAVAWGLLVLMVVPLAWYCLVWDPREYRVFKAVDSPAGRLGYFRRWVLRGALLFTAAPLVILALFGRLGAIVALPSHFAAARAGLTASGQPFHEFASPDALSGFVLAVVFFIVISSVPLAAIQAGRTNGKAVTVGDVEAMLPRNVAEGVWGAALSINAGIGEELLYRLLIPLLLGVATGNVILAFAVSTLLFGLAHVYQGVVGVVVTAALGLFMVALYLGTGQLWMAMVFHAVLDLRSMVFVPAVSAMLARRARAKRTDASPG